MSATLPVGAVIRRLDFQERAVRQVAVRYVRHLREAAAGGASVADGTPFFQAFAAVTLLGKTLVLGDSVTLIAAEMDVQPVVVWLSRGRVLAQTTFNSFQEGGRYDGLLAGGVPVRPLGDLTAGDVVDGAATLVGFGAIDTFTGGEVAGTGFSLAGSDIARLDPALRTALAGRRIADGRRRPLILVYDEAHELSEEHARLLLQLGPDVILLASATMKLPGAIAAVAGRLKASGWRDDELTTIPRLAPAVARGAAATTT